MAERKDHHRKKKIFKVVLAVVYITILSFVGLSFNSTYAIFNTLARTPTSEAVTAENKDLLKVEKHASMPGALSEYEFTITNESNNKLWVYFDIKGSLGLVLQHINPVCLAAGESYQLPIRPANLVFPEKNEVEINELGLLGWRNKDEKFTGTITARVLNNFSSYEVGEVTIKGKDLYEKYIQVEDDPNDEITAIITVQDVLNIIAEKVALKEERDLLIEERDRLLKERDELIEENDRLKQEKYNLRERILSLEDYVDNLNRSLSEARSIIKSSQETPVDTSGEAGDTGDGDNPDNSTDTSVETGENTSESTNNGSDTASTGGNDNAGADSADSAASSSE